MSNQWYDNDTLQWVDTVKEWGFTEGGDPTTTLSGLQNIWTDEDYVYAATASGLDVISIDTEVRQSFATNNEGYSTVWASDTHVFLGTDGDGVKILPKSLIGPEEISFSVGSFLSTPDLLSNNVKYIHGNEHIMAITSDAGVNVFHFGSSFISKCSQTNVGKCFVTQTYNYVYYIVNNNAVHRVLEAVSGWTTPDVIYTAGSEFLTGVTEIRDIFATAKTSLSGEDNTLFLATNNGVFIRDEDTSYAVKYDVS